VQHLLFQHFEGTTWYKHRLISLARPTSALGVPDRASKRLFHTNVLRPKGDTKHCEISQKILSATACRYFIFWVNALLQQVNTNDVPGTHLDQIDRSFFLVPFDANIVWGLPRHDMVVCQKKKLFWNVAAPHPYRKL